MSARLENSLGPVKRFLLSDLRSGASRFGLVMAIAPSFLVRACLPIVLNHLCAHPIWCADALLQARDASATKFFVKPVSGDKILPRMVNKCRRSQWADANLNIHWFCIVRRRCT